VIYDIKVALPYQNLAALVNYRTLALQKPTVIFLHGYLDNADSFTTLLPFFSHYQCIAIDMAGHGKSDHRSADAHYHLSDYAFDVYQLVQTLGLSNFIVVGHSLGAIVGSLYASTQPNGLRGFVTIESCGPLSQDEASTHEQLSECFSSRLKAHNPIKHPTSLDAVIKARCAISDLSGEQASQIMRRNVYMDENNKWLWRTDKRLRTKSAMRMTEQQACAVLSAIQCPRLVILGKQGFKKVKEAIESRKAQFDNVPIELIEGGHHVHLASTADVANTINRYISTWLEKNSISDMT
jgi:pimeloyl-ACP methyl ester carboxylesterase